MTDLVTIGETMVLLSAPRVGRLRDMHYLEVSAAGSESNVAIGLRRMGYRASWIGRIGKDEFGELVLANLRREGVDIGGALFDPTAPTALMFKERRSGNVVKVTYYRGGFAGSRLSVADLDEELIARSRVLHLTGITLALSGTAREAVQYAANVAREAGVTISFDFNYRSALWTKAEAGPALLAMAKLSDLVFASEDELALVGGEDITSVARWLAEDGARSVVVKRGVDGALSITESGVTEEPAPSVTVVDPVGAGDAFVAGYLAGTLDGLDASGRLALGCAAGAYAVTVLGDWEGMPSRQDIELLGGPEGATLR